jgi:hypothetical protein
MFGMKKIFQMYLNNIIFYKTNPYWQ